MDRATIFTALTRRNALRVANGLPRLDLRVEYAHEVAVANQRDFQAFCDAYVADRDIIRQAVLAELRTKHGASFGQTMGGRWAIGALTQKRFAAFMAIQFGVPPRIDVPMKNTVAYGRGGTRV